MSPISQATSNNTYVELVPTALKMSSPVLKPGFLCRSLRASSRRSSRRSGSLYSVPNVAALQGAAHAASQAELACCRLPLASIKVAVLKRLVQKKDSCVRKDVASRVSLESKPSAPLYQHVSPKNTHLLAKSAGETIHKPRRLHNEGLHLCLCFSRSSANLPFSMGSDVEASPLLKTTSACSASSSDAMAAGTVAHFAVQPYSRL